MLKVGKFHAVTQSINNPARHDESGGKIHFVVNRVGCVMLIEAEKVKLKEKLREIENTLPRHCLI